MRIHTIGYLILFASFFVGCKPARDTVIAHQIVSASNVEYITTEFSAPDSAYGWGSPCRIIGSCQDITKQQMDLARLQGKIITLLIDESFTSSLNSNNSYRYYLNNANENLRKKFSFATKAQPYYIAPKIYPEMIIKEGFKIRTVTSCSDSAEWSKIYRNKSDSEIISGCVGFRNLQCDQYRSKCIVYADTYFNYFQGMRNILFFSKEHNTWKLIDWTRYLHW